MPSVSAERIVNMARKKQAVENVEETVVKAEETVAEETVAEETIAQQAAAEEAEQQPAPEKKKRTRSSKKEAGQDVVPEQQLPKKKNDIQELLEKGKAKGTLTNEEILEVLDEEELDVENMEKLMETIENLGI